MEKFTNPVGYLPRRDFQKKNCIKNNENDIVVKRACKIEKSK